MEIVVDTREQAPWTFEGFHVKTTRAKLDAGDYSISGLEPRVSIERKSLDDWIGTVLRERKRFYRELDALRGYEWRAVIVEASVRQILERRYVSQVSPAVVLGFVAEVTVSQSVPVYLGGTRAESQVLALGFLRAAAKRFRARGLQAG